MNSLELLDTLQFDNQLILAEDVNAVTTIEPKVSVLHGLWMLESKRDAVGIQFICQALFAGGFQQSRSIRYGARAPSGFRIGSL